MVPVLVKGPCNCSNVFKPLVHSYSLPPLFFRKLSITCPVIRRKVLVSIRAIPALVGFVSPKTTNLSPALRFKVSLASLGSTILPFLLESQPQMCLFLVELAGLLLQGHSEPDHLRIHYINQQGPHTLGYR